MSRIGIPVKQKYLTPPEVRVAAYIIADIDVSDPTLYQEYRTLSTSAVAQYGGEFLVRGGSTTVLEGEWTPGRVVVLRFDSLAAARRFWESPEYEAARSVRLKAARGQFILVEGV
ncbi:MAG TPA: DUF1330 domain-containing protein [Chloroflexota bacterium]|nr:DUF1330 domain-containing protein [Chloroflexota bacterium]